MISFVVMGHALLPDINESEGEPLIGVRPSQDTRIAQPFTYKLEACDREEVVREKGLEVVEDAERRLVSSLGGSFGVEPHWYRYYEEDIPEPQPTAHDLALRCHLDSMRSDPVFFRDGKWWYYDETWANVHGPFESEDICRNNLRVYMESL